MLGEQPHVLRFRLERGQQQPWQPAGRVLAPLATPAASELVPGRAQVRVTSWIMRFVGQQDNGYGRAQRAARREQVLHSKSTVLLATQGKPW